MARLSSVFFSASLKEVLHFTVEYFNQAQFPSCDNRPTAVLDYLIENYYNAFKAENLDGYCDKLHTRRLLETIEKALGLLKMVNFFERPNYYGFYNQDEKGVCGKNPYRKGTSNNDNTVFAVGRLTENYDTSDADCYQTAGGYRCFTSYKNTPVYFSLESDNSITLSFDGDCTIDHYNNNFFGNSTGGGTTKYKEGERTEVRSIHTNVQDLGKVLEQYPMFKLHSMDIEKGLRLATENKESMLK